jgi:arylsulfatase A
MDWIWILKHSAFNLYNPTCFLSILKIMRKSHLPFLFLLFLIETEANCQGSEKPNIIFFMTDDMGWGDAGCYGHQHIQTPSIDRFASESMLFTDAHSASPVCSPTRASMLTGRTPYRNGVYAVPVGTYFPYLLEEEVTLPELLNDNGYTCCHVGKWHLGEFEDVRGQSTPGTAGYDYWLATVSNAKPDHINPTNFYRNGEAIEVMEGSSSEIIVDEVIRWISEIKPAKKPFFATVWPHEPHTVIGTEQKYIDLYSEDLPEGVREYYGNISQVDNAFGKLIDYLKREGLYNNTIILFTSDNGPAWDANHLDRVQESSGWLRGAKAWLYEGGIRVPTILHWPGKTQPASISHAPINGTDYFPTILDALDIPLPEDRVIDGMSLMSLLETGILAEREKPLYWRYDAVDNHLTMAYREDCWVLLSDSKFDYCELYNLEEDWQQRNNLVFEELEKFAEMKKKLIEWNRSVEEDGPDWWKENPDPLAKWKKNSVIGITRHLQGVIPEKKEFPFSE